MKTDNLVALGILAVLVVVIAGVHLARGTAPGSGYYIQQQAPAGIPQDWMPKSNVTTSLIEDNIRRLEADPTLTPEQRTDAIQQFRAPIQPAFMRSVGIWLAAFFTLAMLSFLYRDNPFYKIAEHAFVGISAAYWMVVAYWQTVVPNLLGKLWPRWTKFNILPGLDVDEIVEVQAAKSWLATDGGFVPLIDYGAAHGDGLTASALQLMNLWYWIPMILGVMLLWRLAPVGAWIARWPLAFILGTTAGIRLTGFLESDFLQQIRATALLPLLDMVYKADGAFDLNMTVYNSINNILIVLGVMCGLVYFFFSIEHRGLAGRAARLGIWVLMITFGAGFGYTVMGRVALLVGRFEFLVKDWLNVVPA